MIEDSHLYAHRGSKQSEWYVYKNATFDGDPIAKIVRHDVILIIRSSEIGHNEEVDIAVLTKGTIGFILTYVSDFESEFVEVRL